MAHTQQSRNANVGVRLQPHVLTYFTNQLLHLNALLKGNASAMSLIIRPEKSSVIFEIPIQASILVNSHRATKHLYYFVPRPGGGKLIFFGAETKRVHAGFAP